MKSASFSFMVCSEESATPFTTDKYPVVSKDNEQVYLPVAQLSGATLEEIREQAHRIVDNTVDSALDKGN